MAQQPLQTEHIEQSHPAVADFIIQMVMANVPAVINTILADPTKKKKFRKGLKVVRDTLNAADLDGTGEGKL